MTDDQRSQLATLLGQYAGEVKSGRAIQSVSAYIDKIEGLFSPKFKVGDTVWTEVALGHAVKVIIDEICPQSYMAHFEGDDWSHSLDERKAFRTKEEALSQKYG